MSRGATPGFVEVDGRRLAYAAFGSADGAPVVYCHGSPGSRVEAELLADAAASAGVRLIAPDRPGVGASAFRARRSIGDWSGTVATIADELDLGTVGVLGFSGGGPYALASALDDPGRISGIGLLAGAVPPEAPQGSVDRSTRIVSAVVRRIPWLARALLRGTAWIAARRSPAFATGFYTDRPVGGGGVDPAVAEVLRDTLLEAVADGARGPVHDLAIVDRPWGIDPGSIDVPVTARYGGRDGAVPASRGEWLVDRLPRATVEVLPDADHLAVLTESGPELLRTVAPRV